MRRRSGIVKRQRPRAQRRASSVERLLHIRPLSGSFSRPSLSISALPFFVIRYPSLPVFSIHFRISNSRSHLLIVPFRIPLLAHSCAFVWFECAAITTSTEILRAPSACTFSADFNGSQHSRNGNLKGLPFASFTFSQVISRSSNVSGSNSVPRILPCQCNVARVGDSPHGQIAVHFIQDCAAAIRHKIIFGGVLDGMRSNNHGGRAIQFRQRTNAAQEFITFALSFELFRRERTLPECR